MLEQEIKKLGFTSRNNGDGSFNVRVRIPEWDVDDVVVVSDDVDNYTINDGGWDDPYPKSDWTLYDAIKDHFKPIED